MAGLDPAIQSWMGGSTAAHGEVGVNLLNPK
jgi:hypothetical protein